MAPDPEEEPARGVEAIRAKAFRQRERLQGLWLEARAERDASTARYRAARADLDRIRSHPLVRAAVALRRLAGPARTSGFAARSPAARAMRPEPVAATWEPDYRAELLGRLAAGAAGPRPLRLASVGRRPSEELRAELRRGGIELAAEADGDADVALLAEPPPGDRLPREGVLVAWVASPGARWVTDPRLDDADLVLVPDERTALAVAGRASLRASVGPSPLATGGVAALVAALRRWAAASHVAVHIGPLTWKAAAGWGDLPFGRAVQKAFRRRGWEATLHVYEDRDAPEARRADLALHIFGNRAPTVRHGQPSVLWLISHPDFVTRDLCERYPIVGVASRTFVDDLEAWLGPDGPAFVVLRQATDPERFFPERGGPSHELLFVGSSRGVRRPILDALAGTPHDLAVYGRAWTPDLLEPRYLRGDWIANQELHRYYAAAAIVLSDAYADMRDEGFIPNRVYDAAASGAFVISEPVAGLDEEFDGGVVTYAGPDELVARVEHYLAHPAERRDLADAARAAVLERHTFDHRVATIVDAAAPLIEAARR